MLEEDVYGPEDCLVPCKEHVSSCCVVTKDVIEIHVVRYCHTSLS